MSKKMITLVMMGVLAIPALADERVRTIEESFEIERGDTLRLDVPVAEIEIRGSEGDLVEIEMIIRCDRSSRCRSRAGDLRLDTHRRAGALEVRVEGYPKSGHRSPGIDLFVRMPADRPLDVDLGVGELSIEGVENDVFVDAGVGEVTVTIPERSVHAVRLDVGVGDAGLRPRQQQVSRSGFLFLGNEVDWRQGRGDAEIVVDLGVGDAEVVLD